MRQWNQELAHRTTVKSLIQVSDKIFENGLSELLGLGIITDYIYHPIRVI